MRISFAVSVLAALVLSVAGTAVAGVGIVYPKGPDPAVRTWASWPYPTACDELSFDPIAVFGGPTEAEQGSGAPEVALKKYLDEGIYPYLPKRFWRLAAGTDTRVAFTSGRLAQGLIWLDFRFANGTWAPQGSPEHCRPRTTREGSRSLHWRLFSDRELKAGSRRASIQVLDVAGCGTPEALLTELDPEFRQDGGKLLLTVWQQVGPACRRANEPLTYSVALPGRLGGRELWDGSVYPPRRVG